MFPTLNCKCFSFDSWTISADEFFFTDENCEFTLKRKHKYCYDSMVNKGEIQ